jgi:alpha-tubulin suppressor-like RCC1 family protein
VAQAARQLGPRNITCMAVGEHGALWAWGLGSSGHLGLGDTNERLVPTLVGAEKIFGGSKVRMAACGYDHTLVVKEADEQWAGRVGLNDEQRRLVPTRVDPQHFAHAPISAVAAGESHSAAVTAGGALYTLGKGDGVVARRSTRAPPPSVPWCASRRRTPRRRAIPQTPPAAPVSRRRGCSSPRPSRPKRPWPQV